jgi:hypothetical protein
MGRRVVATFALVASACEDLSSYDQHCPHRYFALGSGVAGFFHGERHEAVVFGL